MGQKASFFCRSKKERVFWIVQVSSALDKKYSYTFPVAVRTLENISDESKFVASVREDYFDIEEMQQLANLFKGEKEKNILQMLNWNAQPQKNEFYQYQNAKYCAVQKTTGMFS